METLPNACGGRFGTDARNGETLSRNFWRASSSSAIWASVGDDPLPEDLFRYASDGSVSYTTTGDDAYFSLDGVTKLARFNQGNNFGGDYGDWWSNNGFGNPGPNPPPQVQDAFAYPGVHPTLGVEAVALDVIGYDMSAIPEPSSGTIFTIGILGIAIFRRSMAFANRRSGCA